MTAGSSRRMIKTPGTIADFGVEALISLELKKLFPLVPLVAEEDSAILRSGSENPQKDAGYVGNILVDYVVNAVADQPGIVNEGVTSHDVLEAIDRGGKDVVSFGSTRQHIGCWIQLMAPVVS